jgi:flagellar biosynthesis chaperone FliJ
MRGKKVLSRLLRLRELEEELSRQELEMAVMARAKVDEEFEEAARRRAEGRKEFVAGIRERETVRRSGGLMAMEEARADEERIEPKRQAAEEVMRQSRDSFLVCRTGREQVETLLDNQRRLAAGEDARRAQQMLDDWFGRRTR